MPVDDVVVVEWAPTSDPLDTTPTWTDISDKVNLVRVARGATSGPLQLYGTGTCQIVVDNTDATFDPTSWYRWRQVRVRTVDTSTSIFRGFVQQIRHDQTQAPQMASASIECADLMSIVARCFYSGTGVPEEASWARINRVITGVGVPGDWFSNEWSYVIIAEPSTVLDGVETAGVLNVNPLDHIQTVVEAEVGYFWCGADGVLNFRPRYRPPYEISLGASTVFSDTATGTEVPILRASVKLTPPGSEYRNSVTFTGDSGNAQTSSDIPTNWPPESIERTLPIRHDNDAYQNAVLLCELYKQTAVVWPESIEVLTWAHDGHANTLAEVEALDIRDYCQVEFTPVGKTQQTYGVFVERIEHTITPFEWRTRFGFSSADRWTDAWGAWSNYATVDNAELDVHNVGF